VLTTSSFWQVMLTEKVVFCLVTVPTLWVVYGLVLLFMTNLDRPTIALIMMTMPIFAYVGIVVTEAGMVEVKDLRPYFMRLFPSARKRLSQLPQTRKTLQDDLRAFIKSIGTFPKIILTNFCQCADPCYRACVGRSVLCKGTDRLENDPRQIVSSGQ